MEDNGTANTHLLWLVSRGQALIAELYRLSDKVPPVFYPEVDPKYAEILVDYKYFKAPESFEDRMDLTTLELDDEFRESHMPLLERFFQVFEGCVRYYLDLCRFLEELKAGAFIGASVGSILGEQEGKQLLTEAAYIHGALLLCLDLRLHPTLKERLVVSFYRYKGSSGTSAYMDDVIKLCRASGYLPSQTSHPPGYPEQYFGRFPLPRKILGSIVGRLRLDDVYSQIRHYPNPEHRSQALSQQAGYLYVLLYFLPDVLEGEPAVMREIVDKHFNDNWVVPFVAQHTADLTIAWKPYQAARSALDNVHFPAGARKHTQAMRGHLPTLQTRVSQLLCEGVLNGEFLLRSAGQVLSTVRHTNVCLRWLTLHETTRNKKLAEVMQVGGWAPASGGTSGVVMGSQILNLLLDLADVEYRFKTLYQDLLDHKEERWGKSRQGALTAVEELGRVFSGSRVLAREIRDDNLKKWFDSIAREVALLDCKEVTLAGRKIQQLVNALQEVEQFHQFDGHLHLKQYLGQCRENLQDMVRVGNLNGEVMATFAQVSDAGFMFGPILDAYTPQIHAKIRNSPSSVVKLQCLFIKLKSMMELPLLRISQCASPDFLSVSEYFSHQLVTYVRGVLEVVPVSMFQTLDRIVHIQTSCLVELPTRVEKARVREYAQPEERLQLAQATHSIAEFTQGMLSMERTLVGVVEIDPGQLLQEGIRKQLVQRISTLLHSELIFTAKDTSLFGAVRYIPVPFEERLSALAGRMAGFRRSFEYIQDYVNIYGLRVWQEEFQRIINYNVEQECNTFLKKQVGAWESKFQSLAVPVPSFPCQDPHSLNFMGRLTRQLLAQTHPDRTLYLFPLSGWFDPEGREAVGLRMFSLLKDSVGVLGLSGIDRLLCFMTVHRLQIWVQAHCASAAEPYLAIVQAFKASVEPVSGLPENLNGFVTSTEQLSRVMGPLLPTLLDTLTFLGQCQLLRRQIAVEVSSTCKLDSNSLSCALETINDSMLRDVRSPPLSSSPSTASPSSDPPLLARVAEYLTAAGVHNPLAQIYITSQPLKDLPPLLFLITLTQLPKYGYDRHLSVISPRVRKGTPDACALIVGILTLLRQFHPSQTQSYMQYLSQYIRAVLQPNAPFLKDKNAAFSNEAVTALCFLEDFARYGDISQEILQMFLPSLVTDYKELY